MKGQPSTFHPFNLSTVQPFNRSPVHPFNFSPFQPFNFSPVHPFTRLVARRAAHAPRSRRRNTASCHLSLFTCHCADKLAVRPAGGKVGRNAGGISATKGTKRERKTSERITHVREVRLSSRAPTARSRKGGVRRLPECHYADAWETGGMSTLKSRKTASRTGTRLESGWGETTQTTRDNSFKVPGGYLRPAGRCEWKGEDEKKTRGYKGNGMPIHVPPAYRSFTRPPGARPPSARRNPALCAATRPSPANARDGTSPRPP